MKPHSDGAIITGDKQKILAYLQGQDYDMDPEDIEDLYPELMESNYPKPLSIIRQNKLTDDALEEAYGINEKMAMCEQCGKMHEEGACMEMDNDLDPETKGMEEANRLSVKLKGNASKLFDLAKKQGIKNKAYGDKEWNKAVDQAADEMGKKVNFKDIAAVKQAMMHESIKEAKEAKLSPSMKNQIHKIAKKHSGDMEAAMKEISKMKVWKGKGIQDHSYVMDTLKTHNEEIEERVDVDGRLIGFKSAQRRSEGEKQKGKVIVDRRTKGYKEAKVRSEKAKAKRLEAKKQKEFAEKYPKLDYAYGDAAELRKTMEAASEVMGYKKKDEDAAVNNVGDGNVDMNTTGKSKKKKKELMAKRGY